MAAASTHQPRKAAKTMDRSVLMIAIRRPHWPGMRPDGMTRFGSLIASTWRSNQSLTAWLVPQISGPARSMPARR